MPSDTLLDYPTDMPLAVLASSKKRNKKPRLYNLGGYLRREENNKRLYEYYNGLIVKLPPVNGTHNTLTTNISISLKIELKQKEQNYHVRAAKQLVYMPKLNLGLYPDALVVSDTPQYFDKNEVLLINPILIVEVLSKGTKKYDRTEKFDEYRTLDTFKEYVLIDQKKCHIEVRYRETPNTWRYSVVTDMAASLFLESLGCTISVADIYENVKV